MGGTFKLSLWVHFTKRTQLARRVILNRVKDPIMQNKAKYPLHSGISIHKITALTKHIIFLE